MQEGWTKDWKVGGLAAPCLVLASRSLRQPFMEEKTGLAEGRLGPRLSKSVTKPGSGQGSQPGAERAGVITVSDRRQMSLGRVAPA